MYAPLLGAVMLVETSLPYGYVQHAVQTGKIDKRNAFNCFIYEANSSAYSNSLMTPSLGNLVAVPSRRQIFCTSQLWLQTSMTIVNQL